MKEKNWILWSNKKFKIFTPQNPHLPSKEGIHVVVYPKKRVTSAWSNPKLSAETFEIASKVCQTMKKLKMAPWFNIQANGNWHFLTGKHPHFHIHIYARRKGKTWGLPVQLPLKPGTFHNELMSEKERENLSRTLKAYL